MLFQALFMMTLLPAVVLGFRRGGDFVTASIVVIGSWLISYASFRTSNPLWTNAVSDTLSAAFIAILCTTSAVIRVGCLFAVSAFVSIFYGVAIHPKIEYSPIYAHVLSALGHAQNLALLSGAANDGIRNFLYSIIRPMGVSFRGVRFRRSRLNSEDHS